MISYEPFYKTLQRKRLSQYKLVTNFDIPAGTIQRIRSNKSITLNTIEELCKILKCSVGDIVTFI